MGQGQFANQRALIECAEAHDLSYAWDGSPAFAKRWRFAWTLVYAISIVLILHR
jgi:hypothetical protein